MNRPIKKFKVEGEMASDSKMWPIKDHYQNLMLNTMRSRGYVPVLDLDPGWYVWYDEMHDKWYFRLLIHGVYIGKRKSWEYEGLQSGKFLARLTPKTKLKPSLEKSE